MLDDVEILFGAKLWETEEEKEDKRACGRCLDSSCSVCLLRKGDEIYEEQPEEGEGT